MNQNETRTLWISVFSAIFAVFLLYSYTQEKSAELTKKFGAQKKVVVAKADINEMQTIDVSMLELVSKPVSYLEPEHLADPEDAVGLVALAPIKAGEQILRSKIMEPGPVTGLAMQVAPSKRAVTIPIDDMRGVAKLIKPGDRVDVVAAVDIGKGANQRREIKTILQDVVILATGVRVVNELPRLFEKQGRDEYIRNIRDDLSFSSVTVEASPVQAQNLIYILSTSPGSLFLTLRHPSDHADRPIPSSDLQTVLGQVAPQKVRETVREPARVAPQPVPQQKKTRRSGPFKDI